MLARIWGDENCYTLGGRKCHCNTSQSATLCRWIVRALAPENSLTYGCCIRFLMLSKNNSPQRSSLKCHTFISSQPCRFEIRRAWLGSLLGLSRGQSHGVSRAGLLSGVLGRNPLPGSFSWQDSFSSWWFLGQGLCFLVFCWGVCMRGPYSQIQSPLFSQQ